MSARPTTTFEPWTEEELCRALGYSDSASATILRDSASVPRDATRREGDRIRKAAQRQRERRGVIIVTIKLDETSAVHALLSARLLTVNEQDNRGAIARAIEHVLQTLFAEQNARDHT